MDSRTKKLIDLETRKSVQTSMTRTTHTEFRKVLFDYSMGVWVDHIFTLIFKSLKIVFFHVPHVPDIAHFVLLSLPPFVVKCAHEAQEDIENGHDLIVHSGWVD